MKKHVLPLGYRVVEIQPKIVPGSYATPHLGCFCFKVFQKPQEQVWEEKMSYLLQTLKHLKSVMNGPFLRLLTFGHSQGNPSPLQVVH